MGLMSAYSTDIPVSRQQLRDAPIPEALGARHKPIGFGDFVDMVEENLDKTGLIVTSQEHILGHDGNRYFGLMEVKPAIEGELITADDWKVLVGLRGSHDQSIPRGICVGRQVLVCSNLCFGGDLGVATTKQTLNVMQRLPGLVANAVQKVPEVALIEQERVVRMKHYGISQKEGDAILVEMYRQGIITAAQLGRAAEEWVAPTYQEFSDCGWSAWRLEQAVTESLKPTGRSSNIFTTATRAEHASDMITDIVLA